MKRLRSLPLSAAVFALLLAGSPTRAEQQPPAVPTRDVDITYDVTRPPDEPKIRERVRWSASQHLQRIDGPDKSTTIFDDAAHEITLLTPKNRSYRKLEGTPRRPPGPEAGTVLKRGNEAVIAGLHCVDWSWTVDVETHTVCMTPDGVLLRLVIDGRTVMQARSVTYRAQSSDLFQIPRDYSPALAPEGTGL
jgi:hypothetical protein